ncbi:MAG TPA: hypothetical protein ENK77_03420 [Epsilonproteobacteria bacterium]|nr:hypothetical protein [Campylobacterota bacterium]
MMRRSYTLLALLAFFSAGCEEKYPTYAAFCDQNKTQPPSCLHYAVLGVKDKKRLESLFGLQDEEACPYRVELTRYHIGLCDHPIVKSVGSDFNGYVRLEIKKGFKCYYKIQSDFKNDENAAFERVAKKLEKEWSLQNIPN